MTDKKEPAREFFIQETLVTHGPLVKTIRTVHLSEDAQLAADEYNHGDVVTHVIEYTAFQSVSEELEKVKAERDRYKEVIKFLRDNRIHDSRVTELCNKALNSGEK